MNARPARETGFVLIAVLAFLLIGASVALLLVDQGGAGRASLDSAAERIQTDYVAEAGLAHAVWQLRQTQSCADYTNLPDTNFGASMYNATFAPTSGSPVTVSVQGTLANGSTKQLVRDRVKAYASPATLVLQPDPGRRAQDTFIEGDSGHHQDHNKETDKPFEDKPKDRKRVSVAAAV